MVHDLCREGNRKYEAERKIQPGSEKNVEWKSLLRKRSGCKRISGFDLIRGLTDLLGHLLGFGLLKLGDLGQRLAAIDATSPMTTDLLEAIVEVVFGSLDDFVERTLILGVDVGESESGASLHSDHASNPGLALDDAVRDAHLAAESGQVHDQLDRVHVVGDHHELGLLLLHQSGHRVETVSDDGGPLGGSVIFAIDLLFGLGQKTLLLGLLALGAILVQQLESLGGGGSVQGHGELVDRRRDLETLVKDGPLPLEDDVFGPSDEAGQIAFGLDVLPDPEILGPFLEERIDRLLLHLLLDDDGWRRHFLSSLLPLSFHGGFRHDYFIG